MENMHPVTAILTSQTNMTIVLSTTTNAWTSDQINAGWFIIVVIGFFAFIIISSMVVNQLNAEPEEPDSLSDYLEKQPKTESDHVVLFQKNLSGNENQGYCDSSPGNDDSGHDRRPGNKLLGTQKEQKPADQDTVICIVTIT